MPTQLARFTDRCVDLSQKSVVGEPQPALQQGNGGYADWVIVAIHCLREYLNQPYRRLLDILHEMPRITAKLGLAVDELPDFTTDGSDGATVAFDHVLDIATTHDTTVHILNVVDTTQESVLQLRSNSVEVLEDNGKKVVSEAADRANQRGVDTVMEVRQGEAYRTIIDYAETQGIDLVVMPTHGRRGLERFLLGSTTERVVRRADVAVLTLSPDDDARITHPYQDVLVPTDGSDCANQALAIGVDVADTEGAALHLLSAIAIAALGVDVRTDIQMDLLEESATELLDEAERFACDAGIEPASKEIENGSSIHKVILTYIEEHDIDLVVVGTHGRTGFDRYVLGSVTEYLVRTSPIPVLTVPAPDPDTGEIH